MDGQAIRERLKALQEETAQIRDANRLYLTKRSRGPLEIQAHNERALRLGQILGELALLAKAPRDRLKKPHSRARDM
jgi:hypothetical protein